MFISRREIEIRSAQGCEMGNNLVRDYDKSYSQGLPKK